MSDKPWWLDSETRIDEWYNEDWGVGSIHGRQVDGAWEYAFVRWRYTVPTLAFILRGGKKIEE